MRPLNIVCFSDGRPGHEKQSMAVVSALQDLTPIAPTVLTLSHTDGIKRIVQSLRSVFFRSPGQEPLPEPIDIIIGTGSTTHLPMVGLKVKTGAKLITCMSPEPWLKPLFDLCLIPRHDRPAVGNKNFATFGPPCMSLKSARRDEQKGLILVGGVDHKSHRWDTALLLSQINLLLKMSPSIYWTISSSGRTPPDTIEQLHQIANTNSRVSFYSSDETPPGWIESAYAAHEHVWITADSVSMVYEALTAGCRAGVLPVKWIHSSNKFQNGIDDLTEHGLIGDLDQWRNGVPLPVISKPLNEAERCAREIIRRWWPERLT